MRKMKWVVAGPVGIAESGQGEITRLFVERLGGESYLVVDTAAARSLGLSERLRRKFMSEWKLVWTLLRSRPKIFYRSVSSGGGIVFEMPVAVLASLLVERIVVHHHSTYGTRDLSRVRRAVLSCGREKTTHIVLSDRMANDLARELPESKIVLVSNLAFDGSWQSSSLPSLRRESATLRVGLLSNLTVEKGVLVALATIEHLLRRGVDVTLELAGPAQPSIEEAISEASANGLPVLWHGPLYGEEKSAFLQSLDVFLFPSHYQHEAEPLVIYEALAAGAIAVVRDVGAVSEQFPIPVRSQLMAPEDGDPDDLADLLGQLLDSGERERLFQACAAHTVDRRARAQRTLDHLLADV